MWADTWKSDPKSSRGAGTVTCTPSQASQRIHLLSPIRCTILRDKLYRYFLYKASYCWCALRASSGNTCLSRSCFPCAWPLWHLSRGSSIRQGERFSIKNIWCHLCIDGLFLPRYPQMSLNYTVMDRCLYTAVFHIDVSILLRVMCCDCKLNLGHCLLSGHSPAVHTHHHHHHYHTPPQFWICSLWCGGNDTVGLAVMQTQRE